MNRLMRELGPFAVVVVLFAALIGYLLSQGTTVGNWLFAAFLFGHGWVHLMYLMPRRVVQPAADGATTWPFELGHSWLSPAVGRAGALHTVGVGLVLVTALGFCLGALATIPLLVPAAAWAGLVIASSLASATLLSVYFRVSLLIGLAIDATLVLVVVLRVWQPA